MKKPASLRAAWTVALPEFQRDPQRLVMFVDKGRLVARATPGLGYEWRYWLRVEFHESATSPDAIAIPLLIWLREHQPERLLEFAREDNALGFSADILDAKTWDLAWAFELAEAVSVTPDGQGGWDVQHIPEPLLDDALWQGDVPAGTPVRSIWLDDELAAGG